MDPLTAFGLANNILTFIDFTAKVISISTELYESKSGASHDHADIEFVAKHIRELANQIIIPEVAKAVRPQEQSDLSNIGTRCREVADELLSVLTDLRVREPNARWQSFHQALRSQWKQAAIDRLQRRLSELGDLMVDQMNNRHQREISRKLYELAADNKRLEINRTSDIESLQWAVQKLTDEIQKATELGTEGKQKNIYMAQSVNMELVAGKGLDFIAEQSVLNYLRFPMINARRMAIHTAHNATFSWLFRPQSSISTSPDFVQWLESDNPLFWISGKPGSGKSTLMKYICGHGQTQVGLSTWAAEHSLVTANFFFWSPGRAQLQKSQEGLLRSILYQVLRQSPSLIRRVLRDQWQNAESLDPGLDLLGVADLLGVFHEISQHLEMSQTRFCFFIDGLDEYEGKPEDIIKLMQIFSTTPHLKLCISSRPWNEFEKAFGQHSNNKLYMEDLTREDIALYVRATLEKDSSFQQLARIDKRYAKLVEDIVDAAKGVFLWVVLVVRSLLEGFTNSDRISDLQKRLRLIPTDLDAFFESILFTVNDFYRNDAAYAFRVTLAANFELPLMIYWFIDQEDTEPALEIQMKHMSLDDTREKQKQMAKRLNARSMGLLETHWRISVQHLASSSPLLPDTVDFIHRTLRDWLRIPKTQKLLANWSSAKADPNIAICKAILAQLKTIPTSMRKQDSMQYLVKMFFSHAHVLEQEPYSRELEISILDQMGTVLRTFVASSTKSNTYIDFFGVQDQSCKSSNSILDQAARSGLYRYVDLSLEGMSNAELEDLLEKALVASPPNLLMSERYHGIHITNLILERAVDVARVWSSFVYYLGVTYTRDRTLLSTSIVYEIIKAFLEHGKRPGRGWYRFDYDHTTILYNILTTDEVGALGNLSDKPLESTSPLRTSIPLRKQAWRLSLSSSKPSLLSQSSQSLQTPQDIPVREQSRLKKFFKQEDRTAP